MLKAQCFNKIIRKEMDNIGIVMLIHELGNIDREQIHSLGGKNDKVNFL